MSDATQVKLLFVGKHCGLWIVYEGALIIVGKQEKQHRSETGSWLNVISSGKNLSFILTRSLQSVSSFFVIGTYKIGANPR